MELDRSKIELFCKIREEVIFLLGEYKVHDRELAECIAVSVAALFPAWAKERGYVELDKAVPSRRKDFLKLPIEERRRILAKQVEELNNATHDSNAKEDLGMTE